MNKELYDYSKTQEDHFLPTQHTLATIDLNLLRNDFKKFDKTTLWFPNEEKLHMSILAFRQIFEPIICGSRILSIEEVLQRMEKSTSAGIIAQQRGHRTKGDVIKNDLKWLLLQVELIKQGVDVLTIWKTSPKVEIRTLAKLLDPDKNKRKQRTFMCCDIVCYFIGLMLYGDQNDKLLALANTNNWSAVGLSIFHGGWDNMLRNLLSNKNQFDGTPSTGNLECFDIKAMEASMSNYIFDIIYDMRNENILQRTEYEKMINWFLTNKKNSYILDVDGWLCIKTGKNPSGCYNTLTDNTLGTIFNKIYAYSFAVSTVKELVALVEHHKAKVMGDDSIDAEDKINKYILEKTPELGFEFSYETKPPTEIRNAVFLNFGFAFVPDKSMFIFKPNYDKLFAGLYYYRKSNSWRLTLAKLYALRVLCFPNVARRYQLESLIAYTWDKHREDMKNEKTLDDKITFASLPTLALSEPEIQFLLYGEENAITVKPKAHVLIQEVALTILNE